MTDCGNLEKCKFFAEYKSDEKKQLALRGFASMYCQGNRKDQCIRKKISVILGSPARVPSNMMPNGKPLFGSSNNNWDDGVFRTLDTLNVLYFRKQKFDRIKQRVGLHY